jgi:alcohol dehydrogenase
MQKYNWNYPTTMWVGENRINDIALACKNSDINKPLLITDKGLAQSDIVKNEKRIYDLKETLELNTYNSKEKITRALKD